MEIILDPKKCSICHHNPFKYTCPRCALRTCSLACCLTHKKTRHCTGQRDKASFKPLDAMNELDLLSDYRFLEEVHRKVETSQRDELSNQMKSFNESTRFKKLIQTKLRTSARTQVLYLPRFSTKHKQNQMWFDRSPISNRLVSFSWLFFFLQKIQRYLLARRMSIFSSFTNESDILHVLVYASANQSDESRQSRDKISRTMQ